MISVVKMMTNVFFELTTVMKTMEHAQILLVAGLVLVIQGWKLYRETTMIQSVKTSTNSTTEMPLLYLMIAVTTPHVTTSMVATTVLVTMARKRMITPLKHTCANVDECLEETDDCLADANSTNIIGL